MAIAVSETGKVQNPTMGRTTSHSSLTYTQKAGKSWKLTRRGRFVFRGLPLLTVMALLILGAISFFGAQEARAGDESLGQVTGIVQVKAGQSLWDIASDAANQEDVRDVVNEIMSLNELKTAEIQAGDRLEVPVYTAQ